MRYKHDGLVQAITPASPSYTTSLSCVSCYSLTGNDSNRQPDNLSPSLYIWQILTSMYCNVQAVIVVVVSLANLFVFLIQKNGYRQQLVLINITGYRLHWIFRPKLICLLYYVFLRVRFADHDCAHFLEGVRGGGFRPDLSSILF
jgi:hypothetical protein